LAGTQKTCLATAETSSVTKPPEAGLRRAQRRKNPNAGAGCGASACGKLDVVYRHHQMVIFWSLQQHFFTLNSGANADENLVFFAMFTWRVGGMKTAQRYKNF
jgi:hypothetical protein